ncbi:MAG: aminotransferase class V-fold PLP-dependent enzyme, partial [Bacteroidota bacterium]
SLMHINNETGTISDISQISQLCKEHGALFHTDAVQSLGKYDIDLSQLNVSFLSGSAHKIFGPKGSGFLYVNTNNMVQAYIKGGGQERDMRSGTENLHGIIGLAEALDFVIEHRDKHNAHKAGLKKHFIKQLEQLQIPFEINGGRDQHSAPHVLNIGLPRNERSELIMMNLDIYGIAASAGSACSSGVEHESHVIEAMGKSMDWKPIRFSFSHLNTLEEIEKVTETISSLI